VGTEQSYRSGPTALSSFEDQPPGQPHHPSEDWPGSGRGRRVVLCSFTCGGLDSLAAEIVEGGCDVLARAVCLGPVTDGTVPAVAPIGAEASGVKEQDQCVAEPVLVQVRLGQVPGGGVLRALVRGLARARPTRPRRRVAAVGRSAIAGTPSREGRSDRDAGLRESESSDVGTGATWSGRAGAHGPRRVFAHDFGSCESPDDRRAPESPFVQKPGCWGLVRSTRVSGRLDIEKREVAEPVTSGALGEGGPQLVHERRLLPGGTLLT